MSHPLVAMFLAVALLAQTTATAWASHTPPAQPQQEELPCHGEDADAPAADPSPPCECCTSGCLFACGGVPLPPIATVAVLDPPGHPSTAAPVLAPLASHSRTPFRPPAA